MSARRIVWIECDADGDSCQVDSTDGSIEGGATGTTIGVTRGRAKDAGWRGSDGRDICPSCWNEGLR